jgi:hypothetical protein
MTPRPIKATVKIGWLIVMLLNGRVGGESGDLMPMAETRKAACGQPFEVDPDGPGKDCQLIG